MAASGAPVALLEQRLDLLGDQPGQTRSVETWPPGRAVQAGGGSGRSETMGSPAALQPVRADRLAWTFRNHLVSEPDSSGGHAS